MPALVPSLVPRAAAVLLLLTACGPTIGGDGSGSADRTGGTGDSGDSGDSSDSGDPGFPIVEVEDRDLDLLFVVDNSGSMGEEQVTLARSIGPLISVLERPDVNIDYRVGVTTTDDGNPWCQGTGPEAGALRLTSCRSRPTEFVFEGFETIDVTQEACYDLCPEEWTQIDIRPTTAVFGGDEAPRNWIERIDGETNLPEGLSAEQAFMCLAPQGINGCGFESQLESMWKALRRSETEGDPDFGFIREDAALMIVHMTDEVDCSNNPEHETIFLPDGNRVFWSDAGASAPTSAVCWNAGVACNGSGVYDACTAVNLDVDGLELSNNEAPSEAVLHPLSRYIDQVQAIEDQKQLIVPDREVLVSIVGGVNSNGSISYQDSADPEFQDNFGIGPGCSSNAGEAVPPVRLAEFANAFELSGSHNLFSICDSDYSPALDLLFGRVDQIRPACLPACAADTDPATEPVDPLCTLTQRVPTGGGTFEDQVVLPCAGGEVPPGQSVCYEALVGDAMDEYCIDQGFNLQFLVMRREGDPAVGGTVIFADCALSESKAVDCPDLP